MLKQNLQLKLGQKLAPQQIQLMKLIQLHTLDFEEELERELEENPALEKVEEEADYGEEYSELDKLNDEDSDSIETDFDVNEYLFDDEPSYKTASSNYSPDDEEFDQQSVLTEGQTIYDYLIEQIRLRHISGEELVIAEYLIGNLDNDGYIRRELKAIVDDLAFSQGIYTTEERVEEILLNRVQKLDPPGVGARDLQECLLLQIRSKLQTAPNKNTELAEEILKTQFEALTNKHYKKIMQRLDCSEEELKEALDEVSNLSPRLGGNFDTQTITINQEIIPDFTIQVKDNKVTPLLNSKNAPQLRVSSEYRDILDTYSHDKESKDHKQAALFIKQKLDAAKWYIDAINQRQNTLMQTISAIVKLQHEYFLTGDDKSLKPMILKDVADITGFDISTISRVVKSKYADTPNGIVLLKDLFSDSLTNEDGEEVSTKEIKTFLQEVVDNENKRKPYTDDALVKILKDKGYNIARRTIAKYRDQLNIPVARLRKEL
ncbi:RNA polymerase factor sigma-54 [Riemerella anatipestifer]|uniref:DNA-directed RNA polymerase specialized sigma subunit, sigma54-like protein n=1 Tax=Riemerella anatipestifer RA-CH-1 TaxID=1228997 RepID=J9QZR5_RIEAN|nr:RNA polymerase factor sigma-54 [Riemerella anatipestifer]AFR34934.1 DNA-directed RNA polymerase specialized sigma subunit, sigma54-like protein [Riemerella anatipestifer RA-CH-1]MCO7332674.1 RNA polymerase factor sigma-54 [Riemerella anatipestifer]MCO7351601.1 RNA polymerase factor sigma-54 [Riemerella anatipestifer]MCU7583361.1 RNA polymerase factor sigma-54 [Riemerella anatipestifer]MCW0486954.1 RNA polymerase factor sigma-54 [Riemerella anatipestifer]